MYTAVNSVTIFHWSIS